jgi:DNA polymerase elongation subunit (family B)
MYQSIHYDPTSYFYYLKDDEEGWKIFQHKPTYYRYDKNGDYTTLEGRSCTPVYKYDREDPFLLEKDVDKRTRVLVDLYYKDDEPPKTHNIVFIDIENEIEGQLNDETVVAANTKITAIALYDVNTKKYICFVLDESKRIKEANRENADIISCGNEEELLLKFLDKWEELEPTIVVGFNSEFFDIPYTYHRIKRILGDEEVLRLSPVKKIIPPFYDSNSYNKWKEKVALKKKGINKDAILTYTQILGINQLDYMYLFKKFIVKQEPSYKLDDLGTKYVELGKLEYDGSLDILFKEDINKFIDYNIRDVEILVKMEEKLKFVELTITICHLCHVPYESIYYSTVMNEGAILTYLKRLGIVSPNKPTTVNPELRFDPNAEKTDNSYAGGYIKEPIPGLYEWIIDLDFTSLYPSIIRSLNIGIETLVCRIVNRGKYDNQWTLDELKLMDPEDVIKIEKVTDDRKIIASKTTVGRIIHLIEKENCLLAASGAIFRTDVDSVVCNILADWFQKRVEYKNLMKKAYKAGDKAKGEFYDKRQHAYKIKLNDVYGVYAIDGWRYTDGHKIISSAITLTGHRVTQESIKFVNKWLNEQIGSNGKDFVVTSDTDSLFVQVKDLINKRNPNVDWNNREEVVKIVLEIASEIQNEANKFILEFSNRSFNIKTRNNFFDLKQEVVIERGYFAGKRRYAIFIVNKEGVTIDPTSKDALDIKGLDLMKSNFPKVFKNFGEKLYKDIMFGKAKKDIDKDIINFKYSIQELTWKQLSKPTGLKNLDSYIASPPKAGEIFSKLANKCPINTKAAIYYNDLLKFKGLDRKYPMFQVGAKMYIAYLKDNPYKIKCIGFFGMDDPPEIVKFIEEYIDKGQLFDAVMRNKIESLYEDLSWGTPIFNKSVNKFFSFK